MATVYKRGRTYWVRYQWYGQEIRKSARTTSKNEAREYLSEVQEQYRQLDLHGRQRVTFDHAAATYIQEHVAKKKVSTIGFYQQVVRILAKEFSGMYLDQISRAKVANFESAQLRSLSASRVKHYRAALSGIFKTAIRYDWIDGNPCRDLDPIKIDNARYRFLTPAEWKTLKAALPEPERSIAETSVLRGMRLGEILSLKWEHIDEMRDEITMPDTKGNRPRVIPLETAREVFHRQPTRHGVVFPNRYGRPMTVHNTSKRINKLARAAGIEDFTFHDLRHTFASWYVQRGGDLYRLQRILGHKSPAMTQRYAHLRIDDLREPAQMSAQHTRDFLN
ncbi:MAG: tyrosine-type recombinase/integrase [Pseudomonadota bacterium]